MSLSLNKFWYPIPWRPVHYDQWVLILICYTIILTFCFSWQFECYWYSFYLSAPNLHNYSTKWYNHTFGWKCAFHGIILYIVCIIWLHNYSLETDSLKSNYTFLPNSLATSIGMQFFLYIFDLTEVMEPVNFVNKWHDK